MKTYKEKQNNYKLNFVNSNILTLIPGLITIQLNLREYLNCRDRVSSSRYLILISVNQYHTTQHNARTHHPFHSYTPIDYRVSKIRVIGCRSKSITDQNRMFCKTFDINGSGVF